MRIAYFDCFSGASGDMIIGSLLDAGLTLSALRDPLSKLRLPGYRLSARRVQRAGFAGTQFTVKLDKHAPHTSSRRSTGHHHAEHRNLTDILNLLEHSSLSAFVKKQATDVFRRLARAEARVHGKPIKQVHFHEVGAVDSIVDIVGASIALELLGVGAVECSPLALGNGTVQCAHGTLPVPAPATAELLKGVPTRRTEVQGELTTPTGAAVLTALARSFGPLPPMVVDAVGTGAGRADRPELPNLLRVFIGEARAETCADEVAVIETNIDDMSAELCGALIDGLVRGGALDAFLTPIQMKKGRPGVLLTVLTSPDKLPAMERMVFAETTTFGLRVHFAQRRKLDRSWQTVQTPYGSVRVKLGTLDGKVITTSPEYDDCRKLAEEARVPLRSVYDAARRSTEQGS